jgi:hypothetical protein
MTIYYLSDFGINIYHLNLIQHVQSQAPSYTLGVQETFKNYAGGLSELFHKCVVHVQD